MTTTTLTLADFIAREQMEAEAVRIPARTDRTASEWDAKASHWVVALRCVGRGRPQVLAVQYSMGAAHTKAPTCADVLDSLRWDARALDLTFADWCADLGSDEDSRKAEETYRECCFIGGRLAAFLGSRKLFRELLDNVEGL